MDGLNCPKCSSGVSEVDTFCPSCGTFLKEQTFVRKEEKKNETSVGGKILSDEKRTIIECPSCRQRLRVPLHGGTLKIICPRCQGEFLHNFDQA